MQEQSDPRTQIWCDVVAEYARYADYHHLIPKSKRELPNRKFDPKNENPKVQEMVDAVVWLNTTFKEACLTWRRVRDLLPESVWQHYELMEYTDMREQIELESAAENLRKVWAKRPEIFRRSKSYVKSRRAKAKAEREAETDFEDEASA